MAHRTDLAVSASIGIASVAKGATNISRKSLVREADKALYLSKEAGRNCVRITHYGQGVEK